MRQLRVLWSIHLYPPVHNCGSEYMAHHVNKYLVSKGHHVRVILHYSSRNNISCPYEYEGVEVFPESGNVDAYRWADVVITHLDLTQFSVALADLAKRPLIHFVHNDVTYTAIENAFRANYVVYNSNWIADKIKYDRPSFTLHPPCDFEHYNVNENPEENEFITLINLDKNKGGEVLRNVALAMPDRKFLGVIGSYSSPWQIGQITDQPPNVKVVPNTPDVLEVYKQTRILLMPSAYESWGRTATEAMCNGIPVICTPTPGLKENCKDAAIYVPERGKIEEGQEFEPEEYNINPIVEAIKSLDDKEYYNQVSKRSRERAIELKPDLERFEQFLMSAKW